MLSTDRHRGHTLTMRANPQQQDHDLLEAAPGLLARCGSYAKGVLRWLGKQQDHDLHILTGRTMRYCLECEQAREDRQTSG